ncbi:MAG TPA: isoprenyl transferase [Longimicrobiales bacterium]|nr:isoprenyl transferase [Longimicrobiales bacterium]
MSAADLLDRIRVSGDVPRHVAVIMDGNGRWARQRGLPRHLGHREGMKAVREVVEGSVDVGIQVLTLFAFSTENWRRPEQEVSALMSLLQLYARKERDELRRQGVEVHVLGELERVDRATRRAVDTIVDGTRGGTALRLNLMISYGGREEIMRSVRELARRVAAGELAPEQLDDEMFSSTLFTAGLPDPDLLIRTSGEFRVSNFLLWQMAYTELFMSPVLWPDFSRHHLFEAVLDFQGRERRFGRVGAS